MFENGEVFSGFKFAATRDDAPMFDAIQTIQNWHPPPRSLCKIKTVAKFNVEGKVVRDSVVVL